MKFSWMLVISIGIFFSAIALGWGYRNWDPNMKEVRSWKTYRDGLIAESKKAPAAIKRVKDAEALATQAFSRWQNIAATRTIPPTLQQGGIDLGINGWELLIQMPLFRNSLQKMVNNQMKVGGVKVIQGPTVPAPPTDPGQIISQYFNIPVLPPVVIFDLGTVTVQGTYKQITDNMRAWSRMPHFLAVADGLSLTGTSPRLTGTYAVSLVGFVQTTKPIFPPLPEGGRLISTAEGGAAAAAAATGAGTPGVGRGANVPGAPAGKGANVPGKPAGGAAVTPPVGRGGAAVTPPAGRGAGATLPPANAGRGAAGRGAAAQPPVGPAGNRPGAANPAGARPGTGAPAGAGKTGAPAGAAKNGAGGR